MYELLKQFKSPDFCVHVSIRCHHILAYCAVLKLNTFPIYHLVRDIRIWYSGKYNHLKLVTLLVYVFN